MTQALDPAAYIFEGIWTNWSKGGPIRGLTLTLAPIRATLLTNSLALFFALSGGQLWTIVRFILHQLRASHPTEKSNLLLDQQQIILRNATTDLTTTQLMWTQAWASRNAGKSSSRALYIGLLALLHAILFVIGGTFSSQLASAGPDALSRSPHCGVWNLTYYNIALFDGPSPSSQENMTLSFEARTKLHLDIELDYEYAQKCYLSQPGDTTTSVAESTRLDLSPTCNTLKKSRLNWTTMRNGTCPFPQERCHNDSPVIVLDTGIIDTHEDLGINAAPQDRLTYRRVTTCAVLNDTGHLGGFDGYAESPSAHPSQHITYLYYGFNVIRQTNETYAYSNYASFYTNFSAAETAPYHLNSVISYSTSGPSANNGDFIAGPEMQQYSADLTLLFLSYPGSYLQPIDDPWFAAHDKHHFANAYYPFMENQYTRDHPVSTIACIEQHQYCNPSKGLCTPNAGFDGIQSDEAFNSSLTPHQNATFDRMTSTILETRITDVTFSLGMTTGRSLRAMDATANGEHVLSLNLPDDQWQIEVDYWHSIAMAGFQRTMADWATGGVAAQTKYLLPPEMEQDKWFCGSLMVPSTVYQSFSIISIIFMVLTGILIITLSLTIEDWARWTRHRVSHGAVRWQRWVQDDMMNLPVATGRSDWTPQPPPKDHGPATQSRKHSKSIGMDEKASVTTDVSSVSESSRSHTTSRSRDSPPQYHTISPPPGLIQSGGLDQRLEPKHTPGAPPTFWI